MYKELAIQLTKNYFHAWLKQDPVLLKSVLHEDIIVRECIGDIYSGKEDTIDWFNFWNTDNQVLKWDINEYLYDKDHEILIPLWIFRCKYEGREFEFKGNSIIRFENDLIVSIEEYQMEIKE